ncbi:putative motility protein [Paucibacter sp. TC2R-5]|uniref:putative motility protein n=1 Tax=Paucibacter sp. TC2R-5 TaxID=2893555 RepID=UPI0021E5091C|nr:putative motility protein [Paucibacter sp. TC2R-5]MCV2359079.1 putative motility protein [Paucibacter sp. TC2R-5]
MDLANTALVNNVGSSGSSVQSSAQMMVLKKAINLQAQGVMDLLGSLPPTPTQPALATSGSLGTRLNTYA